MQFTAKTESEIAREPLRDAGTYDFTVIEADDAKSKKSGADMIKIKLEVFDTDGSSFYVTDYLMEVMAFKLRHFCFGIGMGPAYEAGTLRAGDLIGKSGKVKIVIKEDPTGQYLPKNEVKDYVVPVAGEPSTPAQPRPQRPAPAPVDDGSGPPF